MAMLQGKAARFYLKEKEDSVLVYLNSPERPSISGTGVGLPWCCP